MRFLLPSFPLEPPHRYVGRFRCGRRAAALSMRFPFDSSGALGVGEAAFFELIELMWALGKLPLLLASSSENFLYCLLP